MEFERTKPFMAAGSTIEKDRWALYGLPFDSTSSYRPGSRFGPQAVREASYALETYDPRIDRDLEDYPFGDIGDIEIPFGDGEKAVRFVQPYVESIIEQGAKPMGIGGEHLMSLPAISALKKKHDDLVLIQFDAHADLREDYLGNRWSHATVIRRALDLVSSERLFQVGIRSGTKEEWNWMREHKTPASPFYEGMSEIAKKIGDLPVYLTIDLDVLDPSIFPGTGTPEPGGIVFSELVGCMEALSLLNIVGADVMELAPEIDATGVSSIVAAKAIRSMLLLM